MGPKRLVRTSARDCQIRGGEYSVDPADYATRLKRLLPLANEGDVEAQTIVGEIHEKGLGMAPNYAEAARWYRRAAEGGSARAAVNLGNLFEHGLGVPKNPPEAAAWYRRALGSNVQFAPPVDTAPPPRPRPTAPPVIRLIQPQLVAARNQTVQMAVVEPDVGRIVVIGRVISSRALKALTVNGAEIRPDGGSGFKHEISLSRPEERVRIIATDQAGLVSSLEFLIRNPSRNVLTPSTSLGSYHALVIGNGRYRQFPALDTVENDAKEVAHVLREKYGIRVMPLLNQTREELLEALEELRKDPSDHVLLYYAGRCQLAPPSRRRDDVTPAFASGHQPVPHWLPFDADPSDPSTWISSSHVTQVLETMRARQVLVVADSCALETRTSSVPYVPPDMSDKERATEILTLAGKRARVIIASGGPAVIRESDPHSIFAEAFIQLLGKNVGAVTGLEMFWRLKQRIAIQIIRLGTEVTYTPISGTVGDFVFVRPGAN